MPRTELFIPQLPTPEPPLNPDYAHALNWLTPGVTVASHTARLIVGLSVCTERDPLTLSEIIAQSAYHGYPNLLLQEGRSNRFLGHLVASGLAEWGVRPEEYPEPVTLQSTALGRLHSSTLATIALWELNNDLSLGQLVSRAVTDRRGKLSDGPALRLEMLRQLSTQGATSVAGLRGRHTTTQHLDRSLGALAKNGIINRFSVPGIEQRVVRIDENILTLPHSGRTDVAAEALRAVCKRLYEAGQSVVEVAALCQEVVQLVPDVATEDLYVKIRRGPKYLSFADRFAIDGKTAPAIVQLTEQAAPAVRELMISLHALRRKKQRVAAHQAGVDLLQDRKLIRALLEKGAPEHLAPSPLSIDARLARLPVKERQQVDRRITMLQAIGLLEIFTVRDVVTPYPALKFRDDIKDRLNPHERQILAVQLGIELPLYGFILSPDKLAENPQATARQLLIYTRSHLGAILLREFGISIDSYIKHN